jgi:hypothetical protein
MGLPGLIGSQVPDGPDAVWVTLKAIQAQAQQVQAQIGSAQALITLATQQNALNSAQIALAANQVVPGVGAASANSFNTTTSYATYASFNLTVPAGYTKAVITVSGNGASATGSTGGDAAYCRVLCNGVAGPEVLGYIQTTMLAVNLAAFGSFSLSALSAGATIPIEIQMRLRSGPPPGSSLWAADQVNVVASALFQK